jgi:hypothetical protein
LRGTNEPARTISSSAIAGLARIVVDDAVRGLAVARRGDVLQAVFTPSFGAVGRRIPEIPRAGVQIGRTVTLAAAGTAPEAARAARAVTGDAFLPGEANTR